MLADHVICGICGKEMYVSVGAEHCPFCNTYGALQFANKCEPEIELTHPLRETMWVCEAGYESSVEYGHGNSEAEAVEDAVSKAGEMPEYYHPEEIWYEETKMQSV